jgi:SOS-response transcriptional repressor LexA
MANETHKPKLTARQKQLYDFISKSILERGAPPTIREMQFDERCAVDSECPD